MHTRGVDDSNRAHPLWPNLSDAPASAQPVVESDELDCAVAAIDNVKAPRPARSDSSKLSGQADDGSNYDSAEEHEYQSQVKCSLLRLKFGEVLEPLAITKPTFGDENLSMGHFFRVAKMKLCVPECDIKLVVGKKSSPNVLSAKDASLKFFHLQGVEDAIGEHGEVNIYVMLAREDAMQSEPGCSVDE